MRFLMNHILIVHMGTVLHPTSLRIASDTLLERFSFGLVNSLIPLFLAFSWERGELLDTLH